MGTFFKLDPQIIFTVQSESVGFALAKYIHKLVVHGRNGQEVNRVGGGSSMKLAYPRKVVQAEGDGAIEASCPSKS